MAETSGSGPPRAMVQTVPLKSRRHLFILMVPLLTCLATLAAVEGGLRLWHPVPFATEVNMYFTPDPHTGYRLQPGSTGRFGPIEAIVNRHGHRDDPVDIEKPGGMLRILILGDSFTMGATVGQAEGYPQRLEALLNPTPTHAVEVVNAGVGGWDPFQYAQYFEHAGRRFAPDLVLVGLFVGNDAYSPLNAVSDLPTAVMGRRVRRESIRDPLLRFKIFVYEHLHLARLLVNRGRASGPQDLDAFRRKNCHDFSPDYLSIQSARLENHLPPDDGRRRLALQNVRHIVRIQRQAAADRARLAVVLIPDELQINPALQSAVIPPGRRAAYDFDQPQRMLAQLLEAENIPVMDLLPIFRADPRCLYMNDTHWTPEGHELAARVIRDWLAASGWLKQDRDPDTPFNRQRGAR